MLKIIATAKIKNKIYATAKIARSIISVPDYVYISIFKIDQLNNGNVIRADDNIIVDYSFVVNKPQLIGYFEVLIDGNVVYTKNTIDSNPITLPPISDGSYSMTMKVYDLSGNEIAETVVYPFQVQVAIQAPIVPNQTDWTFSSMRSVNALQGATDPQGLPLSLDSIVNVTNGSAIIVGNNIEITRNDLNPTTVTFRVTNGFKSTQATAIMDWQALNLTITQPTPQDVIDDGDSVTVDYSLFPSSPATLSHIQKYELYLDGVLQSGMTINNIQAGSRVLRVDAIDTRNNVVATDSITITVNATTNLFLNIYPNNNGESWAHHQLDTNFTGDVIELRRDSDNDIMRFGFDSGEYPLGAMASFVGSGDGLATWWKGQANGLELTNTDAVRQPWLFQSGVLQTLKGEPTLKFEGNHYLNGGDILNINERDFMSAFVGESGNGQETFYAKSRAGSAPNRFFFLNDQVGLRDSSDSNFNLDKDFTNQIGIFNQIIDSNHEVYKNDILEVSVPFTGQMLPSLYLFLIGIYNNNMGDVGTLLPLNGKISELHFYFDEQINNRSLINNLIDNRYNII